jgi:hypothetical protein
MTVQGFEMSAVSGRARRILALAGFRAAAGRDRFQWRRGSEIEFSSH